MPAASHDVLISIHGLVPGMYVSRLDRPWVETDFPLQGLALQSDEAIKKLQRLCSYVYVDTARGVAPHPRFIQLSPPTDERAQREIQGLRKTTWQLETEFQAELPQANAALEDIQSGVVEMMSDISAGRQFDLKRLTHGVETMVGSILRNPNAFSWLREMRRSDEYTYQHAIGTSVWAASFGRQLGLERSELELLALGGLLSDVGKTRLPRELLTSKTALSEPDMALIRTHVEHSVELVSKASGVPSKVIEMVATHHERHDGSGYPNGMAGSDIPIFGRIIGIVDSFDAMTCMRPHMPSLAPHQAVAELYAKRGTLYQPELVEQFIQACGIYPTGSLVELSDGRVGVITEVHSLKRLRPKVMLLLGPDKVPLSEFHTIDMEVHLTAADGQPLNVKHGLSTGAFGIDPRSLFLD